MSLENFCATLKPWAEVSLSQSVFNCDSPGLSYLWSPQWTMIYPQKENVFWD